MTPAWDFTASFATASIQAIFTAGVVAASVMSVAIAVSAVAAARASRCAGGAIQDPSTRSMFEGAAQTPRLENRLDPKRVGQARAPRVGSDACHGRRVCHSQVGTDRASHQRFATDCGPLEHTRQRRQGCGDAAFVVDRRGRFAHHQRIGVVEEPSHAGILQAT